MSWARGSIPSEHDRNIGAYSPPVIRDECMGVYLCSRYPHDQHRFRSPLSCTCIDYSDRRWAHTGAWHYTTFPSCLKQGVAWHFLVHIGIGLIAMTPGTTRKGLALLARLARNAAGQHLRNVPETASCSSAAPAAASACRCMSALAQPIMEGGSSAIHMYPTCCFAASAFTSPPVCRATLCERRASSAARASHHRG